MNKIPLFFITGIVCALVLIGSAGVYGYTRSKEIAELPCLGCLGLNQAPTGVENFRFGTVLDRPHPDYILEKLKTQVVFLHFRIDVCPACDEIEPTVFDIEKKYENVVFLHVNLEHDYKGHDLKLDRKTSRTLYNTYDTTLEDKRKSGGVPMMVIITLNEDEGIVQPYFNTIYGSAYSRGDITGIIDAAQLMHDDHVQDF